MDSLVRGITKGYKVVLGSYLGQPIVGYLKDEEVIVEEAIKEQLEKIGQSHIHLSFHISELSVVKLKLIVELLKQAEDLHEQGKRLESLDILSKIN